MLCHSKSAHSQKTLPLSPPQLAAEGDALRDALPLGVAGGAMFGPASGVASVGMDVREREWFWFGGGHGGCVRRSRPHSHLKIFPTPQDDFDDGHLIDDVDVDDDVDDDDGFDGDDSGAFGDAFPEGDGGEWGDDV